MNEKISVLLVDDNIEFGDLLNEYINRHDDIQVIGVARDGLQAIEMIKILMPDVVILDIVMPNLDGIGVLEKMSTVCLKKRPLFIVLSAIGQDIFIQRAISLGAEYYIVKPFDADILIARIRQIFNEKHIKTFTCGSTASKQKESGGKRASPVNNIEVVTSNLMREAGIPPHMKGYQYIREAVIQTVKNMDKGIGSVTRVLYPSVAAKFNTTSQRVERSIRSAIEAACTRWNRNFINAWFGLGNFGNKAKPTNSEFIAVMADKVRAKMKE